MLNVDEGKFSNTLEASQFLVRSKPSYLGATHELTSQNWSRILRTAATIRAGIPLDVHDYQDQSPEEQIALFRGLFQGAVTDAHRLMERYDFASVSSVLDVGGGSGGLAIALAKANPNLKATVLDLPSVTPITRHFVEEAGVTSRVRILEANAVKASPSGTYEAIVVRHVVQVLGENDARAMLRNLAPSLEPGGAIHLVGWVLDDSRVSPENVVGFGLVLLTAYEDGQAYTEQEYRDWLTEAGFVGTERIVLLDGASIVTARKPE